VALDPRLLRIPRGPVLDLDARERGEAGSWPRVDQQGHTCLTVSGRTAILHALSWLGVGRGDRVLVPTYHCPTMIEPVVLRGAEPVFYPIAENGTPDLAFLRALDCTGSKAMLAAHFFGLPQDMSAVRKFCDDRQLRLIEDCAHAFFGRSQAGPVGATGDVAIASLPKFFPVVEGGCLVTRGVPQSALAAPGWVHEVRAAWDSFEIAAATGRLGALGVAVRALTRAKNRWRRRPQTEGGEAAAREDSPYRTIDPARAHRRAARFVRWVVASTDAERIASARRRNYLRFTQAFARVPGLAPLFPDLPAGAAPYVFPLRVEAPEPLYQRVRARGVPLYRWDVLWPHTPAIAADAGRDWSTHVFQLACHQNMSEADVEAVAAAIQQESQVRST